MILRLAQSVLPALLLAWTGVLADEVPASDNIERISEHEYRIGTIMVDRENLSFSVPGKVLQLKDALEYLAVSREGMKGYESLLELDTEPREFNLACILIGLDESKAVKPQFQFDEQTDGQQVEITVSWEEDGKTRSVSGANAMTAGDEVFDDDSWVYLGSSMSYDGKQYMAEIGGTLIGFVHDPNSVIDHRAGAGIGAYGLITGNEEVLPPQGSPVTLTVSLKASGPDGT